MAANTYVWRDELANDVISNISDRMAMWGAMFSTVDLSTKGVDKLKLGTHETAKAMESVTKGEALAAPDRQVFTFGSTTIEPAAYQITTAIAKTDLATVTDGQLQEISDRFAEAAHQKMIDRIETKIAAHAAANPTTVMGNDAGAIDVLDLQAARTKINRTNKVVGQVGVVVPGGGMDSLEKEWINSAVYGAVRENTINGVPIRNIVGVNIAEDVYLGETATTDVHYGWAGTKKSLYIVWKMMPQISIQAISGDFVNVDLGMPMEMEVGIPGTKHGGLFEVYLGA